MTTYSPYQDKENRWSSHAFIASELKRLPPGSRILDVGTATGTIGRICQNHGFVFSGIEPNREWAQIAAPFYEKIHIGTIESCDDAFLHGYQVVILGDILEHTSTPEAILQQLVRLQATGTLFIISLPNVANIWIRLNLLAGRFDYADRGILDKTHLRFFTRKTATALISSSGLTIGKTAVTPIPLDLVSSFFASSVLGRQMHWALFSFTNIWQTLLGYQFIFFARKEQ
jgi:hypothetical protein